MIGRLMPIAVFVLLGVLLARRPENRRHRRPDLPSPLIGKPMPDVLRCRCWDRRRRSSTATT